jgi:hypothetical protein
MRPACGWPGSGCSTEPARSEPEIGAERTLELEAPRVRLTGTRTDSQRTPRQNPKLEVETRSIQAAGTSTSCSSWWLVRIVVTLAPSSSDSMVPSQSGAMANT